MVETRPKTATSKGIQDTSDSENVKTNSRRSCKTTNAILGESNSKKSISALIYLIVEAEIFEKKKMNN